MTKKETAKFVIQIIVSIASAILTALGATSCMGLYVREASNWVPLFLYCHYMSICQFRARFLFLG